MFAAALFCNRAIVVVKSLTLCGLVGKGQTAVNAQVQRQFRSKGRFPGDKHTAAAQSMLPRY
jgi:hypothetical protein